MVSPGHGGLYKLPRNSRSQIWVTRINRAGLLPRLQFTGNFQRRLKTQSRSVLVRGQIDPRHTLKCSTLPQTCSERKRIRQIMGTGQVTVEDGDERKRLP